MRKRAQDPQVGAEFTSGDGCVRFTVQSDSFIQTFPGTASSKRDLKRYTSRELMRCLEEDVSRFTLRLLGEAASNAVRNNDSSNFFDYIALGDTERTTRASIMRCVRIGTVSFLVEDIPHTIEMNLDRGCDYIREAARLGCDVVCLPEMFRTVNVPGADYDADPFPGPASERLAAVASRERINVIATYYVESEGTIYNQATIFDREGNVVGYYRKVQPTGAEARMISAGSELPVFTLDFGKVAVMICMDIYFGEIPRIYAHKGAEVLFWPTVSHGPTQEGLLAQLTSRAIDTGLIIAESNMAGHPPYAPYAGRYRPGTARIVDANGDVIAQTGRRHGIAFADVDLDEVRLTSYVVLLREPDCFREDLQSITRLDLYADEYAKLAETQRKDQVYFDSTDQIEPARKASA
jgi:predicted amidohydrolase